MFHFGFFNTKGENDENGKNCDNYKNDKNSNYNNILHTWMGCDWYCLLYNQSSWNKETTHTCNCTHTL